MLAHHGAKRVDDDDAGLDLSTSRSMASSTLRQPSVERLLAEVDEATEPSPILAASKKEYCCW